MESDYSQGVLQKHTYGEMCNKELLNKSWYLIIRHDLLFHKGGDGGYTVNLSEWNISGTYMHYIYTSPGCFALVWFYGKIYGIIHIFLNWKIIKTSGCINILAQKIVKIFFTGHLCRNSLEGMGKSCHDGSLPTPFTIFLACGHKELSPGTFSIKKIGNNYYTWRKIISVL